MSRWWVRVLAAAIGGLLLAAAFPPIGVGLTAVLGVALLALAAYRAGIGIGLLTGLVGGGVFFTVLLLWLQVVGTDAWLGLSLFCALWMALLGAGSALVSRLPAWPVWIACLWVLQEALRGSVPYGGFPWGRLAFAQPDTAVGRMASLVGQPGVTFLVALAGTALAAAVLCLGRADRARTAAWLGFAVACLVVPLLIPLAEPTPARTLPVAIVQGGTPQTGLGAMDVRRAVLDNHVEQTMLLAQRVKRGDVTAPAFVLWPENSSDLDPFVDAGAAESISEAARAIGVPILVGAVVNVPGNPNGVWNIGVLWEPSSGPGPVYIKRHPVPFGEYIPMRPLIASLIGRFDRIPRDFIPGDRAGFFRVAGVPFGDVICFEVAYDDVMHPLFASSSRFITVQTNNATYGGSAQPDQQLGIERMRAIEGGRPILVAATTGVSAFIAADGSIVDRLDQGEVGSLVVDVPIAEHRTIATALGDLPEIVLSIIGLLAVVVAIVTTARDRRRSRPRVET